MDPVFFFQILRRIENVNLVHAQARYHKDCYLGVLLPKRNLKRGRPECTDVTSAMEIIYDVINENEDSQFSIKELKSLLTDYIPDDRTIIKKLNDKFEGRIFITPQPGKSSIVTLKDSADHILIDSWYHQKNDDQQSEQLRVVKAAADIIREDIRTKSYDKDSYPSPNNFLKNAKEDVPDSLNIFLKTLAGPRSENESVKRKLLAIAHAIIHVLRPKTFLSCILLALSATLKKNFGSKMLINILNKLGFCASYTETNVFEVSAVNFDECINNESSELVQFIFDNADANMNTIDGHNTFHAMGGIECRTPMPKHLVDENIPRTEKVPNAEVLGKFGYVPLLHYNNLKTGLREIQVANIVTDSKNILPSITDLVWLYGKHKNIPEISGWNGFMQNLTKNEPFEVTQIKTLPFVNSPPSNYDTLNTVLTLACQKTEQNGQKTTFVTFDQPLYAKSREMVAAATETETPLFKNIVIRIGCFHLLMSFMGGIGHIMAGSGLKELWSTIYASNSVIHMLTGHSYSRALRAHLMTYLVLSGLILDETNLEEDECSELKNILYRIDNGITTIDLKNDVFNIITQKFNETLCKIENRSPTAKLWVQYFKMVCLIKKFIEAERSGNWRLHLDTIKQMLPIFVASGHYNYAKSLRIYIQDMENLEKMMPPEEYEKFTDGGFTIRRTEKFWSGTWTDMVIEQSLMRTMKCRGGLTHGRGMTDSVMAKWILSMPIIQKVESCLESFCDLDENIDNVHKDSTPSRMERDDSDTAKLTYWFEEHPPFKKDSENDNIIMSLSTGLVGDTKNINCHLAFEIGQSIISKKSGMPFSELTYARKERVVPLSSINAAVKNQDENEIPIDPLTIFQRISFLKKSEEEMKEYLSYELTPYSLTLFDEIGMRKTKKAALYDLFNPTDVNVSGKKTHY